MVIYQPWSDASGLQIFLGFHAGGINRMWTRTTSATGWYDWKELAGVDALPFQGTYTNVLASRASGVSYTNNTGKPLIVNIGGVRGAASAYSDIAVICNNSTVAAFKRLPTDSMGWLSVTAIVPIGGIYSVSTNNMTINTWRELS